MSDPNNKWDQPEAPPPPMFFGKKERDLVKQVNDELAERVIGQPIAYYPISLEESNFNDIYGEAIDKISLPPVRVYAYVEVENEQSNDRYGYEYQTKLTVNFSEKRITADQNLYVRVGDFVQYGDQFYEIVRTYNDTRFYFGQVEHKFQISAECIRARTDSFRVMPAVTRPGESAAVLADGSAAPASRPGPALPVAATYITMTPESRLTEGRYLAAGSGITLTDGGRQGPLTITSTAGAVALPANSVQYNSGGDFAGSANLTFNGTTLTGSYTGSLAQLTSLSASLVNLIPTSGSLAGRGSYLALDVNNNIVVTSSLGEGLGGIFTTINGSSAYVTSSLAIGGTTAPDHQVSVSGSVSASVNISASAFYGDGSNLSGITTSPATPVSSVQFNSAGDFAGSSNLTFNGTTLTGSYTGSLAELTTLSSSLMSLQPTSGSMAGPGSYLSLDTNNNVVLAAGDGATTSPAPPVNSIQFNNASTFGGSSNLTYDSSTSFMVLSGTMALSSSDDNVAFRIDNAQSTTLGPALFVTGSRGSDGAARQSVGIGTDDPQYALDVRGYLSVGSMGGGYIFVHNDSDTFIRFGQAGSDSMQFKAGNVNFLEFDENGRDWAVFNSASADVDFQVRTLNNTASLFVEGSTDRVGIGTSVPSHTLTTAGNTHLSGGLVHKHTTVSSVYTASVADYILGVSAVPTEIEVDATLFAEGQVLVIKDESGATSVTDTILLSGAAAQTIDGDTTVTMESPYGSLLLYSNGSNWFIY